MPWHNENGELNLLEVNRYITILHGLHTYVLFCTEILTGLGVSVEALAANIETREWRREYKNKGIAPEHPRASTTDDVECFFSSVVRDTVGKDFTLKEVCTVQLWWQ